MFVKTPHCCDVTLYIGRLFILLSILVLCIKVLYDICIKIMQTDLSSLKRLFTVFKWKILHDGGILTRYIKLNRF